MKLYAVGRNKTAWTIYTVFGVMIMISLVALFHCGCQSSKPPATDSGQSGNQSNAVNTVTITQNTPAPTPEVASTPSKPADIAPYSLTKGRRDPFVPFGGAIGGPTVPTVQTPPPGGGPDKPPPGGTDTGPKEPVVTEVPVQVTGTFISGGKVMAIITSASGGPSFIVGNGDKVGEYQVKSINSSRVVLVWSGREYVIKIKEFGPNSSGKGSGSVVGEKPDNKTLPAPEVNTGNEPPRMPPPQKGTKAEPPQSGPPPQGVTPSGPEGNVPKEGVKPPVAPGEGKPGGGSQIPGK